MTVRSASFFPFPIFLEKNLEVYLGNILQTSGFVVSGVGETDGGSVTFLTAPAAGTLVTLRRYLALQRLTDFQDSGQFRAKVLNDELDYLTATVQQLEADAARTIRLNETDSDSPLTLPNTAERVGHTIVFDENGALTTQPAAAIAASAAWHTLDDIPEGTVNQHFSQVERTKLSEIKAGAEANPAQVSEDEKATATETGLRSFSPRDVSDIASRYASNNSVVSVHGRTGAVIAQSGDYTADQISETTSRMVMTADERDKLTGVEAGAQVNAVLSIHGRTGAISAQTGDYTAEQITETTIRVVMTAEERNKLAEIEAGARAYPPLVSATEKLPQHRQKSAPFRQKMLPTSSLR
ncbi:MAG: hypothetical protein HWD60_19620 [Defluviicoccus sp.]|nr:MAG: hypothetical protein HWD60_19620 [Defluviicoccus sp.]